MTIAPVTECERQPATVDVAALLEDIEAFVRRYVVLTEDQLTVVALWVLHTHLIEAAYQTPYLNVTSPDKGCGKSRLLEVLELVVARPVQWTRPSAAVVYRTVQATMPTILLDEVDTIWNEKGEDNEGLRALLNAGHRRGAVVPRMVGLGTNMTVAEFPVFCAKVLAGIGQLPDTVADRSLPVKMKRKTRDEVVNRFRRRLAETEAAPLTQRIEEWAAAALDALRDAEPELPDELTDRQQEAAEPLLAIADTAGEVWSERARTALVHLLAESAGQADESLRMRCLRDCRDVLVGVEHGESVPSVWLVEQLTNLEGAPWVERDLTQNKLAWMLRDYEIVPKKIRFEAEGGSKPLQGYELAPFEDAWKRYLPH